MTATLKTHLLLPLMAIIALCASLQPASAQFEIKDLDVEKGKVELEYNGDGHFGQPARRFRQTTPGPPPEYLFDENEVNRQRHNFELGFGLTDFFQFSIGTELEQQRLDDPPSLADAEAYDNLKATSIQIEGTLVLFPIKQNGFGLGLYGQLEPAIQEGDANHFSVGPVLKAVQGPWSVTLNPWLGHLSGGAHDPAIGVFRDERWSFEYQWQTAYQFSEQISLAIEGYGIVNRLGDSGHPSEAALAFGDQDQHRVGPVVYYTFDAGSLRSASEAKNNDDAKEDGGEGGSEITMSLGVLFGLNANTSDTALKWGMGVEF